jgi:hypothetical protein
MPKSKTLNTWQKTKKYYEARGYVLVKTEHRDAFAKFVTHDLLECIDALALKDGEVIGLQYTNAGNHANHRNKINALIAAGKPIKHWLSVLPLHLISFTPESEEPRIEILGKWADEIFTTG